MKQVYAIIFALIVALALGSCRVQFRREPDVPVLSASVTESPVLTLSGEQLACLDWDGNEASRARVMRKRGVGHSAVEFDIQFPSNEPGNCAVDYVSGGIGGRGILIGLDVSSLETFALQFTLISIDGVTGSDAPRELAVGALLGPTATGKLSHFVPVTLGGSSGWASAVSSTPIEADRVYLIGFHAHLVNPEQWPASGSKVTLRVEPVVDATIRPWPQEMLEE